MSRAATSSPMSDDKPSAFGGRESPCQETTGLAWERRTAPAFVKIEGGACPPQPLGSHRRRRCVAQFVNKISIALGAAFTSVVAVWLFIRTGPRLALDADVPFDNIHFMTNDELRMMILRATSATPEQAEGRGCSQRGARLRAASVLPDRRKHISLLSIFLAGGAEALPSELLAGVSSVERFIIARVSEPESPTE